MADVSRLPGPNADFWDWQMHGACRGMDSAFFFHPDAERGAAREKRIATAKAICATCPVIAHCLKHALDEASSLPFVVAKLAWAKPALLANPI